MSDWRSVYPSLSEFLDDEAEVVAFQEVKLDGRRHLLVTQAAEFEGGQILLRIADDASLEPVGADTIIDVGPTAGSGLVASAADFLRCGASSGSDHRTAFQHQLGQVNVFSSKTGPAGGALACVWAVRHLVKQALGRWITRTDGTAIFAPELLSCFGASQAEADTPAGGLIISPTVSLANGKRNIGHVGILGPGSGGDRQVFSNSSRRAVWTQSHTLDAWRRYYGERKGLKVLYFPLPFHG